MENTEKIDGRNIYTLLEQLKKDHTILNMHVMGTTFDGLTIILGLSDTGNQGFFIDYPGNADSVAPIAEGKKCYFQFSDGAKIQYSFKTTINQIIGRRIKFPFPEYIERAQRRNTFRVPVPPGTKLLYKYADNQLNFDVKNVSESGFLIEADFKQYNKDILYKRKRFNGLVLVYENDEMPVSIKIDSSQIVRQAKYAEEGKLDFGIKIVEIKKDEQNELRKFTYYCQRRVLKERGGYDE
jgi:c-di-GMP-binding flagellar brake protein YcgR